MKKTKIIQFCFSKIHQESYLCIYDRENPGNYLPIYTIETDDSSFECIIPNNWKSPSYRIRMKKYRLEKDGFVIPTGLNKIEINGGMFYLDVCGIDPTSEELNLENIEKLIYVSGQELSEKQKFFISIISLESYFEYIIYVMLVVSRNISKSKYDDLSTACSRSKEAFENNTAFFQTEISVHPGLNIPVKNIEDGEKERILGIFDKIRKLRNDIIHAWSFKDKTFEEIKESLIALGELNIVSNDTDIILRDARNLLVKGYAEIETILRTRIRALEMRRLVNEELESRGFSGTK